MTKKYTQHKIILSILCIELPRIPHIEPFLCARKVEYQPIILVMLGDISKYGLFGDISN